MSAKSCLSADDLIAEFPRLVRLARRYVGNDAEDAAQEAIWKAWSHRDTYDERLRLRNWLLHITQNVCIDMLRSKGRRIQTVNLEHLKRLGHDGMVDRIAAADFVARALLAMPEQMRPVLKLWAAGYSRAEIARKLRIPAGTAATRLMRAKRYASRYAAHMTS